MTAYATAAAQADDPAVRTVFAQLTVYDSPEIGEGSDPELEGTG